MNRSAPFLLALGILAGPPGRAQAVPRILYVSPAGRDAWSGLLPAPNRNHTDGPFASIARARDAIRQIKGAGPPPGSITVQIRGGAYHLDEPIRFGPEDSGTEAGPISYVAYPGEVPELIGGQRLAAYRAPAGGGPVRFDLPDQKTSPWRFRSLFVDGRREPRARYPNSDPADPLRRGFLYAAADPDRIAFGVTVGGIHNAGDWLEYRVAVPEGGSYVLWLHYGARNSPYGIAAMDGRSSVQVDGRGAVPLADLPDTGGWSPTRWARAAALRLAAGEHVLRWQNQKGGGLALDALALCDDPSWVPAGTELMSPERGHLVGRSAKDFVRSHGRQVTVSGAGEGSKAAIRCAPGEFHPAWLSAPGAEVHIFQSGDSRAYSEILSIEGYDPEGGRLLLGGPEARATLNPGDRYFVENVREELDAPGEWFLDPAEGSLSYLPRPGFGPGSEVIVPRTTRLLQLEGWPSTGSPVRYLRFAGLTFRDTDWVRGGASAGYGVGDDGAVYLRDAEACVVEDCRFLDLGAYAVCVVRGRGNTIRSCEVAHAGGGGVLILGSSGNRVADNHIHDLGEAYKHIGGIVLAGAGASGNTLSHNTIHDSPRYGISLKEPGGHNVIEFNRIQNTGLETSDMGGIEVTQHDRAFRSGSVIRGNFVADTLGYSSMFGRPTYLSWGIYLDSFASGYEAEGNVVCRTWNGGIMLQGGRDNRVVNNLFVDGQVSQGTLANFNRGSAGLVVMSNVIAYSAPGAVAFDTGTLGPDVARIDRNLYFPPRGLPPAFGGGSGVTWAGWRGEGRDREGSVADPRFRDPGADDYALLPGSPAFRLGFRPLPAERAGSRTRRCTCRIHPAGRVSWGNQKKTRD
ncbi:MAG TPA: right-handed parallel beta-helix repeat-containing protein [Holophagaceae bacterium]